MGKNIIGLCSCPRLGFMDFMGMSLVALVQNNVSYMNLFGVFWSQALAEGIRNALDNEYDYIITTDYDSIFDKDDVGRLIDLMDNHPEADAISAVQMGRFNGLLMSGMMDKDAMLKQELVPIDTAHFGLTIFRKEAFEGLHKPWFAHRPDEDGEYKKGGKGKLDDDIYFWRNFKYSGKKLFLAPQVVIGHMELLVLWPDENMGESYQTLAHFRNNGKPEDAWGHEWRTALKEAKQQT